MKIVCEACGAKYSIADEKVADRTVKVRCKKCSNVILVRATTAAVETVVDSPPPSPGDPDAIWHVVIDQQQVGPLTVDELAAYVAAGSATADSYVWREGLDDWQPLAIVDELAGPLGLTGAPESAPAEDEQPLFGTSAPTHVSAPAAAEDARRLRGERNESSVLFTLGNLAQLANPVPSASKHAASAPAPGATLEGSGLIDIRSMASAYRGTGAAKPAGASAIGSIDDLPAFASTAFAEPAVILPPVRGATSRGGLVPLLVAMVAVLAIAMTVLIVVVVRDDHTKSASADPAPPQHATIAGSGAAAAMAPGTATPPSTATPPTTAAAPAADPATATSPNATAPPSTSDPRPKTPRTPKAPRAPKAPSTSTATTSTVPSTTKDKCDQVTCMYNDFKDDCCAPFRPSAGAKKKVDTNLPVELDLAMVRTAIAAVKPKAAACGGKSSARGEVKIGVKVSGDGAVTSTKVKESPDAALGDCVAAAVKKASFPKTQKGGAFTYPHRF